ncbi:TPA: hypothetical protein HA371_07220 [Candidatus Woesearchaeota archaeon]|nr:hypothetical protein [Candidatus Woesearchaeota archaeon]
MLIAEEIDETISKSTYVKEHFSKVAAQDRSERDVMFDSHFIIYHRLYVLPKNNSNIITPEYKDDLNLLMKKLLPKEHEFNIELFRINEANKKFNLGEAKIKENIGQSRFQFINGLLSNDYFTENIAKVVLEFQKPKLFLSSAIRIIPSLEHFYTIQNDKDNYQKEREAYSEKKYYKIII